MPKSGSALQKAQKAIQYANEIFEKAEGGLEWAENDIIKIKQKAYSTQPEDTRKKRLG